MVMSVSGRTMESIVACLRGSAAGMRLGRRSKRVRATPDGGNGENVARTVCLVSMWDARDADLLQVSVTLMFENECVIVAFQRAIHTAVRQDAM